MPDEGREKSGGGHEEHRAAEPCRRLLGHSVHRVGGCLAVAVVAAAEGVAFFTGGLLAEAGCVRGSRCFHSITYFELYISRSVPRLQL